ncbi:hypothetical protein ABK040_015333 [Willaertia magna]
MNNPNRSSNPYSIPSNPSSHPQQHQRNPSNNVHHQQHSHQSHHQQHPRQPGNNRNISGRNPPKRNPSYGGSHPHQSHPSTVPSPYHGTPGGVVYGTPTNNQTTNQSNNNNFQQGVKYLTFGKKIVEQLSSRLGFPDYYPCEQIQGKPAELSFHPTFAKEGYIDKSFSFVQPNGTFLNDKLFVEELKSFEQILKEEYKTFSTNKTREEQRLRLDNAVSSCNCSVQPNPVFPKPAETKRENWFKTLSGKQDEGVVMIQKRESPRIPLRDLAPKISHYFVTPNFFDLLSSHNVPFFRALWYTKILIRSKYDASSVANARDLSQELTNRICEYITSSIEENERQGLNNVDIKKKQATALYIINFIGYCMEENLIHESTFTSKLFDLLENRVGLKVKSQNQEISLMEAYFFGMLSVKTSDQIYQQLYNFVSNIKRLSPTTKYVILNLFKLYMKYNTNDLKFIFEIYRRLNPSQQQCLSTENIKPLLYNIKDDIFAINVLDRCDCNLNEIYDTLLQNKEIGIQLISTICNWALTSKRVQPYRPYIAGSLINLFVKQNPDLKKSIQNILFKDVLDSFDGNTEEELLNLIRLFNELIIHQTFSINDYIKCLISRGFKFSKNETFRKRHADFLLCLPSYDSSTKGKINSLLYGPKYNVNSTESKQKVQLEYDIKNRICKLIRGFKSENTTFDDDDDEFDLDGTKKTIKDIKNGLDVGARFELTQWIVEEVNNTQLEILTEDCIRNVMSIMISVGNLKAVRDLLSSLLSRLIDTNSTNNPENSLELMIFTFVSNSIYLFIALDDYQVLEFFLKRYLKPNPTLGNTQTIILKSLSEIISRYKNFIPFDKLKGKYPKIASVLDNLENQDLNSSKKQTLITSAHANHPFIEYLKSYEDTNLQSSSFIITKYLSTYRNSQKLENDNLYALISYCFNRYQITNNTFYVTLLRDLSLYHSLFDYSSSIDIFAKLACDVLSNIHNTDSDKINIVTTLAQFFIHILLSGLISGTTFVNSILTTVVNSLIDILKGVPNKVISSKYLYFIRIFVNFNNHKKSDKISGLFTDSNINVSITSLDKVITEEETTKILFDFFKPVESKTIMNLLATPSTTVKNLTKKYANNVTVANTVTTIYEAMVEILLDFLGNPKALQDICRSISYTRDCLKQLYDLPSMSAGGGRADFGNKYQAITTLMASCYAPFSDVGVVVPHRLLGYLSQSTSISDYISFIISLTKDRWRITIDSHLLFLYMYTWNRRKSLTKDQYLLFASQPNTKKSEDLFYYAKSILLTSFEFEGLKDALLEVAKTAIEKRCDIEYFLPIIDEQIRLDVTKAEAICSSTIKAINACLTNASSLTLFAPQNNITSISERLVTTIICLKDIIFSSKLLDNLLEDRFTDKKRMITQELKQILVTLSTSKIVKTIFTTTTQENSDILSLNNIYPLLYNMLLKLKTPQDEMNKEFEKLFQKEIITRPSTSTPVARRTPGGRQSPIRSPTQSPIVPNSPQVTMGNRTEQNKKISSWYIMEDYVFQCQYCKAKHGNVTPFRFAGKVVKKSDLLFSKKNIHDHKKRKLDGGNIDDAVEDIMEDKMEDITEATQNPQQQAILTQVKKVKM